MNEDMQNNYLSNEERELGTLLENSLIDMQKMDTSELEKILIFEVSNEVLDVNDCIIKYDRKNTIFEDGLDIPFKDDIDIDNW